MKLQSHAVEKPGVGWISRHLREHPTAPIGEVWFEAPAGQDLPLLVKYIFTSEKLSVQVHPNDEQAHARGLARGKNECWYILDAQAAHAGPRPQSAVSADDLRKAAIDGSIEHLMDWKPVARGRLLLRPGRDHPCDRCRASCCWKFSRTPTSPTGCTTTAGRGRLHLADGDRGSQSLSSIHSFNCRPAAGPDEQCLVDGPSFQLDPGQLRGPYSALAGRTTQMGNATSREGRLERRQCRRGRMPALEPDAPISFSDSAIVLIGAQGSLGH